MVSARLRSNTGKCLLEARLGVSPGPEGCSPTSHNCVPTNALNMATWRGVHGILSEELQAGGY
jgi:hypothetical protein